MKFSPFAYDDCHNIRTAETNDDIKLLKFAIHRFMISAVLSKAAEKWEITMKYWASKAGL